MAAASLSLSAPMCYNHPEKRADFKCFDCKYDRIICLCPQCNIQVHSLDVFKAHRYEKIEVMGKQRRLSQDVQDIEKLLEVEHELLQSVLTRLKYTEEEEKETLSQLVKMQLATKRRVAEIKGCAGAVEKAFQYLAKVSNMLIQCSTPDEGSSSELDQAVADTDATVTVKQPDSSESDSFKLPTSVPAQDTPHGNEEQEVPEEPKVQLSKEMEGKEVFPVSVIGSLARNGSFWISKTGEPAMEVRKEITMAISNHFKKHGFGNPVVPKDGTFCAALNRQSKEFCRTRVESVPSSEKCKIRFLDYGFVEESVPSVLCELSPDLDEKFIPYQAFQACLLPNLDTQLPYEAKWCFKDLTFSRELMAAVQGQVTDKKGFVIYHVLLSTCGDNSVCINSKVAQLVDEQELATEDCPVQPREAKASAKESVFQMDAGEAQTQDTGAACSVAEEVDREQDVSVGETVAKTDTEHSVSEEKVTGKDNILLNAGIIGSKQALRPEAEEFVPLSPEKDEMPNKITSQLASKQARIPGILHLPVQSSFAKALFTSESKVDSVPSSDHLLNEMPASELQVKDVLVFNHQGNQMSGLKDQAENMPTSESQTQNEPPSEYSVEGAAKKMRTEQQVSDVPASELGVKQGSTSQHLGSEAPILGPEVSEVFSIEHYRNTVPDNHLSVGEVDVAMYNYILNKCSLSFICMEELPYARFVVIKSDPRRIIEAMKFDVWCSNTKTNRRLNSTFNSVRSGGKGSVFLLFAGHKLISFCGLAEMLTSVDPTQSCPMLNEPFKFGGKMVGRCDIRWIYANSLYFKDIKFRPESRVCVRNLTDAFDGCEISDDMGWSIVKAYESITYFNSILQYAINTHQSNICNQKEKKLRSDAELPWWKSAREEGSDDSPASQEDWDQEIENSLKTSEGSGTDKDKTDASVEVNSDGCVNLSVDSTHVSTDGPGYSDQGADQIESDKEVVVNEHDSRRPNATVMVRLESSDPNRIKIENNVISTDEEPDGIIENQGIAVVNDIISQPLKSEEEIPRDPLTENNSHAPFSFSDKESRSSSAISPAGETAEVPGNSSDLESRMPNKASLKEAETVLFNDGGDWEVRKPSKTSLKEAEIVPSNDGSGWEVRTPSKTSLKEAETVLSNDGSDWEVRTPSKTSLEEAETVPCHDGSDWEVRTPSKTSLEVAETVPSNDGSDWEVRTPSKTSLKEAETVPSNDGSDWEVRTPSKTSLKEAETVLSNDGSDWEVRTPSKTSLEEAETIPSNNESDWEVRTPSKTSLEEAETVPSHDGSDWEVRTPSKTSLKEAETVPSNDGSDWEVRTPSKTSLEEAETVPSNDGSDWEVRTPSKTSFEEDKAVPSNDGSDWETKTPSQTNLEGVQTVPSNDGSDWEVRTPSKTSLERNEGGPTSASSSLSKTSVETETAAKSTYISPLEKLSKTGERVYTVTPLATTSDLETGIPDKTLPQEQTGVVPTMSRTILDEESESQFAGGSDWETPSKTSLVEGTAVQPSGESDWETGTPSKTSLDTDSLAQPPPLSHKNTANLLENSLKNEMAEYYCGLSDLAPGGPSNSRLLQTTSAAHGRLDDIPAIGGLANSDSYLEVSSRSLLSPELLSQESLEELVISDHVPLEIGKEHSVIVQEDLTNCGTFWAKITRARKEEDAFVDAMVRMGTQIEASNKTLDPSEIFIYKQCAVKGRDGYWYRALVEKTLDKGKIYIRLLDIGDVWEVNQRDLRVLDDKFYTSPPAQAFECCIVNSNSASKKEKTRIAKLVRRNKKIRVLVKGYSAGTVEVQVLS